MVDPSPTIASNYLIISTSTKKLNSLLKLSTLIDMSIFLKVSLLVKINAYNMKMSSIWFLLMLFKNKKAHINSLKLCTISFMQRF